MQIQGPFLLEGTLGPSTLWHTRRQHVLAASTPRNSTSLANCIATLLSGSHEGKQSTWGFCPVMSLPSTTTCSVQLFPWQQDKDT